MRLAFVSPLPPSASGVADYSARLAPALAAAGVATTLFHEGDETPDADAVAGLPTRPVSALPERAADFDLILYQVGNSPSHHAEIRAVLLELPGVVVLHEFMLHHLVRGVTLDADDPAAYVEEMRYCAGESGRAAAQRLLDTHRPVDLWSFPLFERIVDRSLGVVVHSEYARQRILASRAGAAVDVVPFPVVRWPSGAGGDRERGRRELGIDRGAFVLATFGLVTPQKRLEPSLAAFSRLRRDLPEARFLICGEISPHYDLRDRIAVLGSDGVTVTGRLDDRRYRDALAACDLAVVLRHPTGGETSAALLDLLARGTPTVVSDLGSFGELPDGTVAKVAIDEYEIDHLLVLFRRLARDHDLRIRMGRAAFDHVARECSIERSVAAYLAILERVAAARPVLAPAAHPLERGPASDPRRRLAVSVGRDLADLGCDERDLPLLAQLAEELVGVGWAAPGKAE